MNIAKYTLLITGFLSASVLFATGSFAKEEVVPAERIKILSETGQTVPLSSILPEHSGMRILEMENDFQSMISPGVEGIYEIRLTVLEHHDYVVPIIRLNGKMVPPEIKRSSPFVSLRYQAVPVDGSGVKISFDIPEKKRVGLLSIASRMDRKNFAVLDAWNRKDGVAQTWFYSPKQFTNYILLVRPDSDAELFVNGKKFAAFRAGEEKSVKILWHKINSKGITNIELKHAPGTEFVVKTSPLGGAGFFREIPEFLKTPEHVPAQWDTICLDNGRLRIEVAKENFYQGSRFEHAGIITSAVSNGVSFFGVFFDPAKRNPKFHDNVAGQAEEFEPIGFEDAPAGGVFIRIGNGLYQKPNMPQPFFAMPYTPIKILPWKTERNGNRMSFTQVLPETNGYAYMYVKTIELAEDKPELKITYSFKNTGKKLIRTTQYAHNFLQIDKRQANEDFRIAYPEQCTVLQEGKRVKYATPGKGHFSVTGFEKTKNPQIRIEHILTKTGVLLKLGFIPYRHILWFGNGFICPESFKLVDLLPGESDSWSRTYSFFTK